MTYAIDKSSPAVDGIPLDKSFAITDQRGIFRFNQPLDIGSYEYQGVILRLKDRIR